MEKKAVSEEGDHVPRERQAENTERQLQKVGRVAPVISMCAHGVGSGRPRSH